MHLRFLIVLFLLCLGQFLSGQTVTTGPHPEAGLPIIQNFSPEDYQGVDQNLAIAMGQDGILYVANRNGLLTYDGFSWEKQFLGSMRSIAIDDDNHIFTGALGQIGVFLNDSVNQLKFQALTKNIPSEHRDFKAVDRVIHTGNSVFFCTQHYLFKWGYQSNPLEGEMEVFYSEENFDAFFEINKNLYVRRRGIGLTRFTGEGFELVPGGEVLAGSAVRAILNLPDNNGFVIGTYRHGLYQFNGENITPFTPGPETQKVLNGKYIFLGETLKNGDWVIQMLPNTMIITDPTGKLKHVFNKNMGLRDDVIWDVVDDKQGGLWLALNDGLARIEMPSPITIFDERIEMGRSINAVIRYEDELYFGSQNALLKLKKPQNTESPPDINVLTELTVQTTSFVPYESSLLASGTVNAVEIKRNNIEKKFSAGTTLIYQSPFDPNIVYVAFADGIRIYRHDTQTLSGRIEEIKNLVLSIKEEKPGLIWVGIPNGLVKLTLNPTDLSNLSENMTLTTQEVLFFDKTKDELSSWNYPFGAEGKILIGTAKGIRSLDSETQRFVLDSTLGAKFADTTREVYRIFETNPEEYWIVSFFNENELQLDKLTKNDQGEYISETRPYEKIKELGTIFSIYPDPNDQNIIWFGGTNGVIRYDTSIEKEINTTISAKIRKVVLQDSLILYGGGYLSADLAGKPIRIDYTTSSIRFEYAIPIFEDADKTMFQYTLEGFEKNWSIWTTKTEKEYGNLPEGAYTFKVRARDRYGNISPEGVIKLRVRPPWYRTWWAFVLYGLFTFIFIALTVYLYSQWRNKQLKARNAELEETVEKRTVEIKEKNFQLAESLDHLKQTQKQLVMQEKMASLGQLSLGIAHEIKNPLNFVNNFAVSSAEVVDELKEELEKTLTSRPEEEQELITELLGEAQKYAGLIQKHGVRADGIVSSLMNHANNNQGERQEVNVNALINEQVNLGYQGFKVKNEDFEVDLAMELTPDLPHLKINPQEFGRVIINIVNNAFFAVDQKKQANDKDDYIPQIKVKTILAEKKIEVRLWDNGIGIIEKNQSQIFQPFFTTKATGQGSVGLGLSISYDIITEGHGGEIMVESKAGEYTEFIISLPLAE